MPWYERDADVGSCSAYCFCPLFLENKAQDKTFHS